MPFLEQHSLFVDLRSVIIDKTGKTGKTGVA
jgi:hypothetical protein